MSRSTSKHTRSFSTQGLFGYIESLSGKLKEAENELRDKKDVIKLIRNRLEEVEKQIQECQSEKVNVFATQLSLCALTSIGSTFFCFGIGRW